MMAAADTRIRDLPELASRPKQLAGDAPIIPVLLLITGGYLAWFAIHYWKDTKTLWPSTPIKDILQGKGLPTPTRENTTAEIDQAVITARSTITAPTPSGSQTLPIGDLGGTGTGAQNQAIGQLMAAAAPYNWGGDDWLCLKTGWEEESGWSATAANNPADPYNHAYGIPQSNPGTKMASEGADWKTNPRTQIAWGLNYIKQTYGSPSRVPGWTINGPAPGYVGY